MQVARVQLLVILGTDARRRPQLPTGHVPADVSGQQDDVTAGVRRRRAAAVVRRSRRVDGTDRRRARPGQLCVFVGLLHHRSVLTARRTHRQRQVSTELDFVSTIG